ncbi:unnamed protein product [Gordionus sp. m RMFG-2023]
MVYVLTWDQFEKKVEEIFNKNPSKTRFTIKYIHKLGKVWFKVTDDLECWQYKTRYLQDFKKYEKLNNNLLRLMSKDTK